MDVLKMHVGLSGIRINLTDTNNLNYKKYQNGAVVRVIEEYDFNGNQIN